MTNEDQASQELNQAPGIFSIPFEDKTSGEETATESTHRQGAAISTWSQDDQSSADGPTAQSDDFPMVVWLRGDEPWYSEFDMDADAAMHTLGIKRSRLTQIAGKDLRVGRVRVDRYIRPVFRSRDIEQYLNQTRATASHQKSSDAINSATERLCQQIDHFESRLGVINENLMTQINSALQNVLTETMTVVTGGISERLDSLETNMVNRVSVLTQDTMVKHLDTLRDGLATAVKNLLNSLASSRDELAAAQQTQQATLTELTSKLSTLNEKMNSVTDKVTEAQDSLGRSLRSIMVDLADIRKPAKFTREKSEKSKHGVQTSTWTPALGRMPRVPSRRKKRYMR